MTNEPQRADNDFRKMIIEKTLHNKNEHKEVKDEPELITEPCGSMLDKTLKKRTKIEESNLNEDNKEREEILDVLKGNEDKIAGLLKNLL